MNRSSTVHERTVVIHLFAFISPSELAQNVYSLVPYNNNQVTGVTCRYQSVACEAKKVIGVTNAAAVHRRIASSSNQNALRRQQTRSQNEAICMRQGSPVVAVLLSQSCWTPCTILRTLEIYVLPVPRVACGDSMSLRCAAMCAARVLDDAAAATRASAITNRSRRCSFDDMSSPHEDPLLDRTEPGVRARGVGLELGVSLTVLAFDSSACLVTTCVFGAQDSRGGESICRTFRATAPARPSIACSCSKKQ
eukprot:COSAG03_NODE_3741_length_1852_cov_1.812892_2_plen_251_part_00